ncbi:MAG: 3-isopropylmalate dehydrogenase [Nevskiaceae bacterium]|nr:MAG: 3-isopropylmalate dehydrogenase [Nevskiaceae bacterium]TBR73876.1 MAG: 3-isopropylmalate dehydrogenase [Nevskiaceae bacterium]
MTHKILVLPGDGIGPEVMAQAVRVLDTFKAEGEALEWSFGLLGGCAVDAEGDPYPASTRAAARAADAVLLAAVGGPKYDNLPRDKRPERGLLAIRKDLNLFANLRPALAFEELADSSSLKREVVAGLDLLILRELTGGIYFGQPRGRRQDDNGDEQGFDSMYYSVPEVERIARVAFDAARKRGKRLTSVDKENVLETSRVWRETVARIGRDYPDVELSHLYVDNAAMQLVRNPRQFDVIVTGNMFGDILSDEASMITGSIGMLPSASLDEHGKGMYEPVHGSAPDIAGQDKANPLATILSVGMMFRYSFARGDLADRIEAAVKRVLANGLRTGDIARKGEAVTGTRAMGDAVVAALATNKR